MMKVKYAILGHFPNMETTLGAIKALKQEAFAASQIEVFTPLYSHEIDQELHKSLPPSPVRYFTFIGGLSGFLLAFLFTSWMSVDYPIQVGAKPLISIPAFVVIAFECTVLLSALFTLAAMLFFSRLPALSVSNAYRSAFAEDSFGIAVLHQEEGSSKIAEKLRELGAQKVEGVYVA